MWLLSYCQKGNSGVLKKLLHNPGTTITQERCKTQATGSHQVRTGCICKYDEASLNSKVWNNWIVRFLKFTQ